MLTNNPAEGAEQDFEEENTHLLRFLYACPIGLLEFDGEGQIRMMNPHAVQVLLPLAPGGLVTNFFSIMEGVAPEVRNLAETFPKRQGKVCEAHRIVVRPGTRDNNFVANVLACTLVKLANDRFAVTIVDVSAEVARERRLKQAEVWFASLMDDINDFAVLSMDAEGRVENINASTTRQTGYTEQDLVGAVPECLEVSDTGSTVITLKEQLACAARDGWHLSEGWQRKRNGELHWCQRLVAVRNDVEHANGRSVLGYLMVLRDVSRKHAEASQIVDLLRKDHLTGACNRAHFFTVAEREFTRARQTGQPLAMIAIDLDHFKRVNDTHGHAAGDEVLKIFTEVARGLLRPGDTFARLGGEEFCALLPNTTLGHAVNIAERMRAGLASRKLATHNLSVTASFGCAEMDGFTAGSSDLLAVADQALYTAKRAGRDRTEPSPETTTEQRWLG